MSMAHGYEPYCSASVGLLKAERHIGSIGFGPNNKGIWLDNVRISTVVRQRDTSKSSHLVASDILPLFRSSCSAGSDPFHLPTRRISGACPNTRRWISRCIFENQRNRHEKMKSIDANNKNTETTKKKLRQRRNATMNSVAAGRASIGLADVNDGVRKAYLDNRARTEARSAVKPVIIS